jgi:hypothetical protein
MSQQPISDMNAEIGLIPHRGKGGEPRRSHGI